MRFPFRTNQSTWSPTNSQSVFKRLFRLGPEMLNYSHSFDFPELSKKKKQKQINSRNKQSSVKLVRLWHSVSVCESRSSFPDKFIPFMIRPRVSFKWFRRRIVSVCASSVNKLNHHEPRWNWKFIGFLSVNSTSITSIDRLLYIVSIRVNFDCKYKMNLP